MKGYFLCVDLLGFSEIIKNLGQDAANLKIESWVKLVEKLVIKHKLEKYQLLSDTLFIGLEDNVADLNKIIEFSRDLLNNSVPHPMFIVCAAGRLINVLFCMTTIMLNINNL